MAGKKSFEKKNAGMKKRMGKMALLELNETHLSISFMRISRSLKGIVPNDGSARSRVIISCDGNPTD